ncbi:9771_t:CDS:2 [Acaulospora colombiana]|uniref:9771_t:CDS:1 n=1 Tax=Acaulospora colombiana TaxID=27376 RepID=A0ACA9K216_9GLOM|nr:9771_t:CDS:2 [Acaulospora colombiana]
MSKKYVEKLEISTEYTFINAKQQAVNIPIYKLGYYAKRTHSNQQDLTTVELDLDPHHIL